MGDEKALALIERVKNGEAAAFEEFLRESQDRIVNAIYRMVGDWDDALDLAQVTFLKAYKGIGKFEGKSRLYTWLYRIAVNTVLSNRRKRSVREDARTVSLDREGPSGEGGLRDAFPADGASPGEAAMERERAGLVTRAIGELDEEFRVVVVLKDIESLSYDEIAEVLSCPRGTVKSRLHRARLVLKEKVKDII
jgi:RNA polymerase sigma-70 factor (ECF subfamily)